MTVALVGMGPAREAVRAALADVEEPVGDVDPGGIAGADLAVAIGQAGDQVFGRVDAAAGEGMPWLAVEIGGVGGYPVVEAAVSGFGPDTGCYDCLRERVGANVDPEADPQAAPDAGTARLAGAVAGREAARFVDEGTLSLRGRVREIPHAERRFLPVPGCECGGDRDHEPRRTHVERDTEESLARAERALDERVGIVAEVGEVESYPAPYYLATNCDTARFSDASAARNAAGVAADWDAAFMKALGEALERYSAGVYRTEALEAGTPDEVEGAVPPSAFVRPDDAPDGDPAEVSWVPGVALATGGAVRLPAEFAYFPPPSERHRPAITTGLGLENGGVGALLSGLYETIERDAAMLSWYSTYEPLGLSVDDEGFATLERRARSEDLSVTPLLLTQDVDVPVVAVVVRRDAWPRFAIGSGAHLDPARAARSALSEALQNWMELRGMGPDEAGEEDGAIGRYADSPPEGGSLDPDRTIPAGSVGAEPVPAGEDHLDAVVGRAREAGLSVYGTRTTPRDVAALDFEAVRVLVPAAQPLFFDEPYFGERARAVPSALGFEPRPDRDHHPFP